MFYEKLRELRVAAGKTQKDLADYLMISPQSVSKWEMGESLPSMEYLPKIAQFLSCTPNDFFDREEYQSVELEKKEDEACLKKAKLRQVEQMIKELERTLIYFVLMECKQEEQKMENEFKRKLMEKYKEDEKLEQYNAIRRKQKELDYKNEIEKQWKHKLEELQLQQEKELQELENKKQIEETQRILIEQEKARLIKENEELLKQYNIKGYYSSVSSLNNPNSVN